jgi:hypothetical protein
MERGKEKWKGEGDMGGPLRFGMMGNLVIKYLLLINCIMV